MVATALAFEEATHLPARPPSLRAWLVSLLFPRQLSSQIPLVKLGSELVDRRKTTDTDEEDIREDIHWSNEKEHYEFISPPCSSCGIRSSEDDDEFENGQEDPTTTREVSSSQEFDREKWTRVKRTTSNAGSAARLSQEGLSRGQRKGRRLKEAFEDEAANDEETEEERLLRSWLNSLAPQRIHLVSLLDPSIRTALPLLKAADIIKPRSVDWSKTYPLPFKPLVQKICCVTNGECLIQTLKGWGLQLVNIGGIDLAEGNRKAILSLVYQMMRYELALLLKGSSHILEGCSGSQSLEKHVVQWANAKLAARKGSSRGGGQDD